MPSKSNIHIDAPLSNFLVATAMNDFIIEKLLPVIKVTKESDKYFIFDNAEKRRILTDSDRAIGAKSREIDFEYTNATFSCNEHALSHMIADRTRALADEPIKLEQDAVLSLKQKLLLNQEKDGIDGIFVDGGLTSAVPSVKWDATSGTITIEKDVDTGVEAIRKAIGTHPNMMTLSHAVAKVIKRDSTLRDLIRYTIEADKGLALLTQKNGGLPPVLFGLEVLLSPTTYNSSNEGQTASTDDLLSDDVLISYTNPRPSLYNHSLGYTFKSQDWTVSTWREAGRKGDVYEVSHIFDQKLTSTSAGYIVDNVLT